MRKHILAHGDKLNNNNNRKNIVVANFKMEKNTERKKKVRKIYIRIRSKWRFKRRSTQAHIIFYSFK